MLQRYVSKELTHFVGKYLKDRYQDPDQSENEQYKLLVKILIEGLLKGNDLTDDEIKSGQIESVKIFDKGSFSKETWIKVKTVCFCDIPVNDLGIHMNKYSKFGLSFVKEFLIEKRANPVFYVAIDSKPPTPPTVKTIANRGDWFNKELINFCKLLSPIMGTESSEVYKDILNNFREFIWFFGKDILPFLKPFECCKSDNDKENYYMEREWRVLGFVKFELKDVSRIILPKSYIKRFKADFPDYYGQITFSDDYSLPE